MSTTTLDSQRPERERLSREIVVLAAVVILGTSITVLDLTIVNVAIPTLGGDLDATRRHQSLMTQHLGRGRG
jgi:hypothetical protein